MSQEDAKNFKDQFSQLTISTSFERALPGFEKLILDYQETYKTFMAQVWLKPEQYLTFLKYPAPIRKYIYTTNVSENFHRRLEWLRQRMGGFFQSEEVLGINIVLQLDRLTDFFPRFGGIYRFPDDCGDKRARLCLFWFIWSLWSV